MTLNKIKDFVKNKISICLLTLFFLNFLLLCDINVIAQIGVITLDGKKITQFESKQRIDLAGEDILYQGDGIVFYEGKHPDNLDEIRFDGACIDEEGTTTMFRCANFTVPEAYRPGIVELNAWIFYYYTDYDNCEYVEVIWELFDNRGTLLSEPYCVNPGETYNFCFGATMTSNCDIVESCLVPYMVQCDRVPELLDDYKSKQGTPMAAYANQYACLAAKACKEFPPDSNSDIPNFVNYLFDWMDSHNEGNRGSDLFCEDYIWDSCCFARAGTQHLKNELGPAFFNYCNYIRNEDDIDKWTTDHETFISEVVEPCFEENGDLNFFMKNAGEIFTKDMVRHIRNDAQKYCSEIKGITPPSFDLEDLPTLYYPEISNQNTIPLNEEDLLIPVGGSINVNSSNYLKKRSNIPVSYTLSVSEDIATISDDGILTIHSTYLPFQNGRALIYVFVQQGELNSIGQYIIYDNDTDNDGIVDSEEMKLGLNHLVANDINSDLDNDGLDDFTEVMMGTDPLAIDSDGDTLSDSEEYGNGTDALYGKICGAVVQSDKVVSSNATLKLKATQSITLNSGFYATQKSSLYATIENCD